MDSYAQERATEFAAFVKANSDTKTWTDNIKNLEQEHINTTGILTVEQN